MYSIGWLDIKAVSRLPKAIENYLKTKFLLFLSEWEVQAHILNSWKVIFVCVAAPWIVTTF